MSPAFNKLLIFEIVWPSIFKPNRNFGKNLIVKFRRRTAKRRDEEVDKFSFNNDITGTDDYCWRSSNLPASCEGVIGVEKVELMGLPRLQCCQFCIRVSLYN